MRNLLLAFVIAIIVCGCGTLTTEDKAAIKEKVIQIIKVSGKAAAEIYIKEKIQDGTLTQEQATAIEEVVNTVTK